jgi:predicted dehydrogenase/threonine dehydrogenase-like Zn-dependent dehydrogenase
MVDLAPVRSWILSQLPEPWRPPLRRSYRFTRDVGQALGARRRLVGVERVLWLRAEVADLDRFRLLGPGPGQVLLRTHATLVSPGTERAFLQGLPNTGAAFPTVPGYSAAGVVERTGRGVRGLAPGTRVAGIAPHASHAVADAALLVPIPDGVGDHEACFVELGVITLQGVRRARILPGERVVVLGLGLIGQLALQLGRWVGAAPLVAVARSNAWFEAARASGADACLALAGQPDAHRSLAADVVLEATGSPQAVRTACECARPGGRVVLLGSSRGVTSGFDFERLVAARGVELLGAHVSSVAAQESAPGRWTRRDEARLFLDLAARRTLRLEPLVGRIVRPADANAVYDELLASEHGAIGIVFDWKQHGRSRPAMSSPVSGPAPGSSPAPAPEAGSNRTGTPRPLRLGFIGCGEIAAHNAAGVAASARCKLVQVMDLNEDAARSLGRQFRVPYTTDLDELLGNRDVDAVVIAVPHNLHAQVALRAAAAGKHVVVEKPIATTLADADAMIAGCRQAGVALSVLFSFRYEPPVLRAREIVQAGGLGTIVGTHIGFTTEKPAGYWGQGYTGKVLTDWRGSKEKCGGGVLIMNVCHTIDYFRFVTGLEVTRAYSEYGTLNSPVEVEDIITVALRYDGGAVGSIHAATLAREDKRSEERIWGTHGSLDLAPEPRVYTMRRVADLAPGRWQTLGKLAKANRVAVYFDRLAAAIAAGRPPEVTGEDGRVNLAVVLAAYESSERGRPVAPDGVVAGAARS